MYKRHAAKITKGSVLVFRLGDVIVYGNEGVFSVGEYTSSPIDKKDERVYYVLIPIIGAANNRILAPSEGGSVPMRAVMSRDEANDLIARISEIPEVTVVNERERKENYRTVMREGGSDALISIIKTVRRRRAEFLAQKRRLAETDTDFEGRAKRCLFGELSVALGITIAEAEAIVAGEICK